MQLADLQAAYSPDEKIKYKGHLVSNWPPMPSVPNSYILRILFDFMSSTDLRTLQMVTN